MAAMPKKAINSIYIKACNGLRLVSWQRVAQNFIESVNFPLILTGLVHDIYAFHGRNSIPTRNIIIECYPLNISRRIDLVCNYNIVRRCLVPDPIAQIEEIMPDGSLADFGDIGHGTLVVVGLHSPPHIMDEVFVKPFFDDFIYSIAFVNQQI